jgi:hypothetical protein
LRAWCMVSVMFGVCGVCVCVRVVCVMYVCGVCVLLKKMSTHTKKS